MNMTIYGRHNVTKYREIKNGEQYIILHLSYKLDFLDKREINYL